MFNTDLKKYINGGLNQNIQQQPPSSRHFNLIKLKFAAIKNGNYFKYSCASIGLILSYNVIRAKIHPWGGKSVD